MNADFPGDARPADARPVAFVHLGYGLDAVQYRARFLAGDEPDATPYGFHVAEQLGVRVLFSHDHPENAATRFLRRAAKRVLGFDALHLWRNRANVQRADVVWTMQESEWLALRFVGLFAPKLRRPVVGNTVWLFDRWEKLNPLLRRLYVRLSRGPGVLTVHSDRYLPLMRRVLPDARVELMYFGTSTEAHPMHPPTMGDRGAEPGAARPVRVLAAGNDRTRDWQTLLDAIGNDPAFEIELVCNWVDADTRARYRSVRPRDPMATHRLDAFKQLYRWADLVVVPMHENRFSGITVALEAVANGKPLIASRTGGVTTYFGEDAVRYVDPANPAALREAARMSPAEALARAEAAQDTFRRRDYSLTGLMGRYCTLSRTLVTGARADAWRALPTTEQA